MCPSLHLVCCIEYCLIFLFTDGVFTVDDLECYAAPDGLDAICLAYASLVAIPFPGVDCGPSKSDDTIRSTSNSSTKHSQSYILHDMLFAEVPPAVDELVDVLSNESPAHGRGLLRCGIA